MRGRIAIFFAPRIRVRSAHPNAVRCRAVLVHSAREWTTVRCPQIPPRALRPRKRGSVQNRRRASSGLSSADSKPERVCAPVNTPDVMMYGVGPASTTRNDEYKRGTNYPSRATIPGARPVPRVPSIHSKSCRV